MFTQKHNTLHWCHIDRMGDISFYLRSKDKHKPIATRTALTLSVLRATHRCLCYLRYFDNACIYKHCRTELSSLRSVGMT